MLRIRLLGAPSLARDGEAARLEGRKTWALLTYLLLEPHPPTRRELVDRLWSEADDPLGAARWALSQVRKALAGAATIVERDGRLVLEPATDLSIDARELLDGRWDASNVEAIVRGELLEGMDFDEAPEFARWLGIQRARVSSAAADALRSAATFFARSEPERALALAERGLLVDPFDDALHALIVGVHVVRGDVVRARAYVESVDRRYRTELGVSAPATISHAIDRPQLQSDLAARQPASHVRALLDSAMARSQGGDAAGAVDLAQRALRDSVVIGEHVLEMQALTDTTNYMTLALVGEPKEWNAMLQRASAIATGIDDRRALAVIERERGRIASIQGSYGAAEAALRRSWALAVELEDTRFIALARLFLGVCLTDRCEYASAEEELRAAVADHRRPEIAMAWYSRLLVKMGRHEEAEEVADRAIEGMTRDMYVIQMPLALAQAGEVRLARGDDTIAAERFARAFSVAREMGDYDWMALALRGLALLDLRDGRPERARQTMREALAHATARPGCYRWVEVAILADLAEMEQGADPSLIDRGLRIALAAPMPDLADRFVRLRRAHTPLHTVAP
jgi:DNA-binding SARP family transcriptional activator